MERPSFSYRNQSLIQCQHRGRIRMPSIVSCMAASSCDLRFLVRYLLYRFPLWPLIVNLGYPSGAGKAPYYTVNLSGYLSGCALAGKDVLNSYEPFFFHGNIILVNWRGSDRSQTGIQVPLQVLPLLTISSLSPFRRNVKR